MRIFDPVDPAYAGSSCRRYLRTETAPAGTLGNYGQMSRVHGYDVPAWIGEPDVTSIGLLALSAYYQARPNATTADILTKIADGIAQYHFGDDSTHPWGYVPACANALAENRIPGART
ncbi:MAG: hypothetical protein U0703_10650 [Anaerolineae bacterium]